MWESFDMPFGHTEIKDTLLRGDEVRLLLIEGAQESAMYLAPELRREPVFPYVASFVSLLPSLKEDSHLLILGGGAFTMPAHIITHYPEMSVDVVELYRQIYELALDYFYLSELYTEYDLKKTERMRVFIEDAAHYIRHTKEKYDLIYDDVYQGLLPADSLLTYEAAVAMKNLLKRDGILCINFIGALEGIKSMRPLLSRAILSKIFLHVELRQTENREPGDPKQNLLLLASDGELPPTRIGGSGRYSANWKEY